MRQPALARLDDADLADMVHAEHAALLGASARPEFVRIRRWPQAIPQYTRGHSARIAQCEKTERDFPGLFFHANYRDGISIGDCIKSAYFAAGEVTAFLGSA
jgi:oxygen-dependent protoporphyrinogen oxidase